MMIRKNNLNYATDYLYCLYCYCYCRQVLSSVRFF